MFEWEDVATKTEMEFVLKCIHEKIWNKKIVKIFDLYGNTFNWKKKKIVMFVQMMMFILCLKIIVVLLLI